MNKFKLRKVKKFIAPIILWLCSATIIFSLSPILTANSASRILQLSVIISLIYSLDIFQANNFKSLIERNYTNRIAALTLPLLFLITAFHLKQGNLNLSTFIEAIILVFMVFYIRKMQLSGSVLHGTITSSIVALSTILLLFAESLNLIHLADILIVALLFLFLICLKINSKLKINFSHLNLTRAFNNLAMFFLSTRLELGFLKFSNLSTSIYFFLFVKIIIYFLAIFDLYATSKFPKLIFRCKLNQIGILRKNFLFSFFLTILLSAPFLFAYMGMLDYFNKFKILDSIKLIPIIYLYFILHGFFAFENLLFSYKVNENKDKNLIIFYIFFGFSIFIVTNFSRSLGEFFFYQSLLTLFFIFTKSIYRLYCESFAKNI